MKFITIFLLSFGIFVNAQQKQQILFCSEIDNPVQQEFVKSNNIQNIYIFYQDYIIDSNLMLNKEKLKKEINRQIPNENANGYAALDVEGESLLILLKEKKVNANEYTKILNNYINSIKFAKSLRPNIKWTFYGFNLTSYPFVTPGHEKIVLDTYPLLKELDFLSPSMYLQDKKSILSQNKIDKFVTSNIIFSLRIAKQLKKPIYPFVWNRYHNVQSSNTLIDPDEFKWYINKILGITYQKTKVNGVVFWNCETYTYQTNNDKSVRNEFKTIRDLNQYQKKILQQYWNKIIKK